jgi:hypothetical protein
MINHTSKIMALVAFAIGTATMAAATEWPPPPSHGFITGRAAQKDDIAKGNAVFVAIVNGVAVGKPLAIKIPQYALLRDAHQPVILVQAEEANGLRVYGVRGLNGQNSVVTESDVELLGTKRPPN